MSFDVNSPNILSGRNPDGKLIQVVHKYEGYVPEPQVQEETPRSLAECYLEDVTDAFDLSTISQNLNASPTVDLTRDYVELRFGGEIQKSLQSSIFFVETFFGIEVWRKGITVNVETEALAVRSAVSTFSYANIEITKPNESELENFQDITPQQLSDLLSIDGYSEIVIDNSEELYVFEFVAAKRFCLTIREGFTTPTYDPNNIPNVDSNILDGNFYIVREVLFSYPKVGNGLYNWHCFIEIHSGSILYIEVFSSSVTASLFPYDPITLGYNVTGNDSASILDALLPSQAQALTLNNLQSPVSGVQSLKGSNAYIIDPTASIDYSDPLHDPKPDAVPPTGPSPKGIPPTTNSLYFGYSVRTEEFSAVSAYYYVDKFFELLNSIGLTLTGVNGLLPNSTLPLHIDHRAFDDQNSKSASGQGGPGGSTTIGMRCGRMMYNNSTAQTDYLGIGTSFRMLLHEIGHCLSYDHFHSPNMPFSHGFGDSLAVLVNDPYSNVQDKGVTFPWLLTVPYNAGMLDGGWNVSDRRNDYYLNMQNGWYWGGSKDDASYRAESLLASTLYLIYSALGGDSSLQARKITASKMVIMLLLKTIKHYTTTNAPLHAFMLANDMWYFDTDLNIANPPNQIDGIRMASTNKVIRWGFEKMAAYDPVGSSYPPPLTPPDYDVYIDDGRAGEYQYIITFWNTAEIVNRHQNDGTTNFVHQNPSPNATNFLFVRIKNRGTLTANNIFINGYSTFPSGGSVWPQDWGLLNSQPVSGGSNLAPNADRIIGPITWTAPSLFAHVCIMITVTADGDYPNTFFNVTPTPPLPNWFLIPNDNNIAQRNMSAISAIDGSKALAVAIPELGFKVRNPYKGPVTVTLELALPELMASKGWNISFDTGNEIQLEDFDREGVLVTPEVTEGEAFTRDEVLQTDDRNIIIYMNTEYGCIGGMTYYLDPDFGEG